LSFILLFAGCQHYIAGEFGDEPDFNVVYQLKIAKYGSLSKGSHS